MSLKLLCSALILLQLAKVVFKGRMITDSDKVFVNDYVDYYKDHHWRPAFPALVPASPITTGVQAQ